MGTKIKDTLSSEFDAFSTNYTADMEVVVPHYKRLMTCFNTYIPADFKAEKILDIGAGNGNSTARIVDRFPTAQFSFIDASPEMLAICKARFIDLDAQYIESYFSDVHYEQNHYDLILAGFSLHHCNAEEKKFLFKEFRKTLKQGGVLAISDLFITKSDDTHPQLLKEWEHFINSNDPSGEKWLWLKEHYDAFDSPHNFESQKQWLLDAGFTSVEIGWSEGYWMHVLAK